MLLSPTGARLPSLAPTLQNIHPFDNPDVWAVAPAYAPPLKEKDIQIMQDRIDGVIGSTADRGSGITSIIKLVWSGDQRFWMQFYNRWDGMGNPIGQMERRPRIRWKALRGPHGKRIRDVFPPRWMLLTRLEPEQYEATWAKESWFRDPATGIQQPIRDPNPPKVYWMNLSVIAEHNGFCCKEAKAHEYICYGKYAPPEYGMKTIYAQAEAMRNIRRNPFAEVTSEDAAEYNDEYTGYLWELKELMDEAEIMIEHPEALIGVQGGHAADLGPKESKKQVKEFYDKLISRLGNMAGRYRKGK